MSGVYRVLSTEVRSDGESQHQQRTVDVSYPARISGAITRFVVAADEGSIGPGDEVYIDHNGLARRHVASREAAIRLMITAIGNESPQASLFEVYERCAVIFMELADEQRKKGFG